MKNLFIILNFLDLELNNKDTEIRIKLFCLNRKQKN